MNQDTPASGAAGEALAGDGAGRTETAEQVAGPETIAALEAEKLDLKDRLMRALADTENLRRRSEREVADARTYAVTNFARDMLTVADNLRRALDSVPREGGELDETVRPLVEGLELTERDLQKTLARHGVKLLEPEGSRFDPNMHQAMFEVQTEDVASGTVVQVVQSGYAIGDRVLRPALVGVAKGAPRAAPSSPAESDLAAPGA